MKIAFVTLGFQPYRTSGFDVSGERLIRMLLDAGHEVTVIAASHGKIVEEFTHARMSVHRLNLGMTDWIGYAFRASRLLSQLGSFDVVHFWDVHFAYGYPDRYVATLHQSFRQRIDVLSKGKSIQSKLSPRWLYYFLARYFIEPLCLRKATGLLAVSESTKKEFVNFYHTPGEKIAITRHGLDVDFFSPQNKGAEYRSKYGIAENDPVILFAGFITPRKGLEFVVQALPQMNPSPRLLLAGRWRDEIYRREIIDISNPYSGQIVELGFIPDGELPGLYSMADVYISGSLIEGFGLPLGEALACGTPVVAFDAGSTAEVVGPGGILVPTGDSAALAEAVSYLLQNPDARRSMAEAGRQHVIREFSVEKMICSTLEAYNRFLGVNSKSGDREF